MMPLFYGSNLISIFQIPVFSRFDARLVRLLVSRVSESFDNPGI